MVLVTTCLILKWLHQWFFDNGEQEHIPTVKIKLKLEPLESKKCAVANKDQSFLEKELQSVKAVLDMKESELRKLRKLLDREFIKETRHNWSQTSPETFSTLPSINTDQEIFHTKEPDKICLKRGRWVKF